LEVAYQGGTSNIKTQSSGLGVGLGRGGLGLGIGGGKTSGTSQTKLAVKASPPKKLRYTPWVILLIIGWVVATEARLDHLVWLIVGIVAIAGSICMGYLTYNFNAKKWPGMYQNWLESWICHTCGKIFHQSEAAS